MDFKESQQLGIIMVILQGLEECYRILNFRAVKMAKSKSRITRIMSRAIGGILLLMSFLLDLEARSFIISLPHSRICRHRIKFRVIARSSSFKKLMVDR